MKVQTVYLAGPIDFLTDGQRSDACALAIRLKAEAKKHLLESSYWVFDPADAWSAGAGSAPTELVQDINMDAVEKCDIMVAVLVRGVLSVGTVLEIQHAASMIPSKKVVVIGDLGTNSVAMAYLGVEPKPNIYETGL